jgi:hypothetical protein
MIIKHYCQQIHELRGKTWHLKFIQYIYFSVLFLVGSALFGVQSMENHGEQVDPSNL